MVGPIVEERNSSFGKVNPLHRRVARHFPRTPDREDRRTAVWSGDLECAGVVRVVSMGQSPDEPARFVDAPPLSVYGDPVSVSFIGCWIHHNAPPKTTGIPARVKRPRTTCPSAAASAIVPRRPCSQRPPRAASW